MYICPKCCEETEAFATHNCDETKAITHMGALRAIMNRFDGDLGAVMRDVKQLRQWTRAIEAMSDRVKRLEDRVISIDKGLAKDIPQIESAIHDMQHNCDAKEYLSPSDYNPQVIAQFWFDQATQLKSAMAHLQKVLSAKNKRLKELNEDMQKMQSSHGDLNAKLKDCKEALHQALINDRESRSENKRLRDELTVEKHQKVFKKEIDKHTECQSVGEAIFNQGCKL